MKFSTFQIYSIKELFGKKFYAGLKFFALPIVYYFQKYLFCSVKLKIMYIMRRLVPYVLNSRETIYVSFRRRPLRLRKSLRSHSGHLLHFHYYDDLKN